MTDRLTRADELRLAEETLEKIDELERIVRGYPDSESKSVVLASLEDTRTFAHETIERLQRQASQDERP